MVDRGAGKMSTKDVEHERCWAGKIVSTDCWRVGRQEMTVSGAYDLLLQWQEAEWGKRAVRAYMGYDYIISRTVGANQEFPALTSCHVTSINSNESSLSCTWHLKLAFWVILCTFKLRHTCAWPARRCRSCDEVDYVIKTSRSAIFSSGGGGPPPPKTAFWVILCTFKSGDARAWLGWAEITSYYVIKPFRTFHRGGGGGGASANQRPLSAPTPRQPIRGHCAENPNSLTTIEFN